MKPEQLVTVEAEIRQREAEYRRLRDVVREGGDDEEVGRAATALVVCLRLLTDLYTRVSK